MYQPPLAHVLLPLLQSMAHCSACEPPKKSSEATAEKAQQSLHFWLLMPGSLLRWSTLLLSVSLLGMCSLNSRS